MSDGPTPTVRCRAPRGLANTEYVLILAIVAGGVLIGASLLGQVQQETFGKLASIDTGYAPRAAPRTAHVDTVNDSPEGGVWESFRTFADHRLGTGVFAVATLALLMSRIARQRATITAPAVVPLPLPVALQATIFDKRQQILRALSHDDHVTADRMLVKHVMTPKLVQVSLTTRAEEVAERMQSKKLRHIVVCDLHGKLVGVISDRDITSRRGLTAAELMTREPKTVTSESLVVPAITWMITERISCLPVVDGEKLVGLVTTTDLLMALQCSLQIIEQVKQELRGVDPRDDAAKTPPERELLASIAR